MKRYEKVLIAVCSILIMVFIFFVVSRSCVFQNQLYVKLLSEETYFKFSKHTASRDILNEYKHTKQNHMVHYVKEGADYLLYKNDSNVLYIITIKNGKLENIKYEPQFSYEVDGRYVHFFFEDETLECADGVMIRMITNASGEEKNMYYIPVNTQTSNYENIISIDQLSDLKVLDVDFQIEYVQSF